MERRTIRAMCAALRNHPYVHVFSLLLLTVVAILGVLMGVWCNSSCSCTQSQEKVNPTGTFVLHAIISEGQVLSSYLSPGKSTWQSINGWCSGSNPGSLTLTYTPPAGVTNLQFEGRQPDEIRPDGSYVFHNVPLGPSMGDNERATETINVRFSAPLLPEGQDELHIASTLTVTHPNGEHVSSQCVQTVRNSGSDASAESSPPPPALKLPPSTGARTEDYYLWKVYTWSSIFDVNVTTNLCQQWVDLLQQGKVFVGVRFPLLNATPPYTDTYQMPVAFTGQYSPTLELLDFSSGPSRSVLTIPVTYMPAYHTFLSNALPWEDDERWFALGADDSQPITCPEGLNIGTGYWEVAARLWLDFGGAEGDCANCVLPVYYCYQGDQWPAFAGAASGLLSLSSTAYQGWGITCMGPQLLRLANGMTVPQFGISETATRMVSPTEQITLYHRLRNAGTETITLTVAVTSTLGADWSLYTDYGPPLTQPIVLTKDLGYGFRVKGTIPADAHGPYTVYVTATSATPPNPSVQITDLLWVGDWESPPPPTTWYRMRFPVVMRQ